MLSNIEIGTIQNLLIDNGYVLNFSTNSFDTFTTESIGVPLCEQYKLSKGKSLVAYCKEAEPRDVLKLLSDLVKYYELNILSIDTPPDVRDRYQKCRAIIDRELGTIQIETPAVSNVDLSYIQSVAQRAYGDIEAGNFDSALTKARTLLEEVFCHAIEAKGNVPSDKGDARKLYNQVKSLYNMHQAHDVDTRVNNLLSGLEKILTSIIEMRNDSSDSHGVGTRRITIKDYHARLVVNAAMTMAEFILSVEQNAL